MAVLEFDGSDDFIVCSAGAVGLITDFALDEYTLLTIAKPTSLLNTESFIGVQNNPSGSGLLTSLCKDGGSNLALASDLNFSGGNAAMSTGWQILAVSKSAGSVAPRFHRKLLGSGSWTHNTGSPAFFGDSGTPNRIELGAFLSGGFSSFNDTRMAVAAIFAYDLGDTSIEDFQTTPSTQRVYDYTPLALWETTTAAALVDLMGGGANETSRTGTTVITGDDPTGWTFGIAPPGLTSVGRPDYSRFPKSPLAGR